MADSSEEHCDKSDLTDRKVWTFIIRGGECFRLNFNERIGPVLDHDGGMTMWKMVGTEKEADAVKDLVVTVAMCRVERHTETATAEMLAIRNERLRGPTPSMES